MADEESRQAASSRIGKARGRLRKTIGAFALAAAAFAGGTQTGEDLPDANTLAGLMGTLNPDGITYEELRFHPMNGRLEGVVVEIPTEEWPSGKLKDYGKRLYLMHLRLQDVIAARRDFEEAVLDSIRAEGEAGKADSIAAAWSRGVAADWEPQVVIEEVE